MSAVSSVVGLWRCLLYISTRGTIFCWVMRSRLPTRKAPDKWSEREYLARFSRNTLSIATKSGRKLGFEVGIHSSHKL